VTAVIDFDKEITAAAESIRQSASAVAVTRLHLNCKPVRHWGFRRGEVVHTQFCRATTELVRSMQCLARAIKSNQQIGYIDPVSVELAHEDMKMAMNWVMEAR
jgi:hypothetical protein